MKHKPQLPEQDPLGIGLYSAALGGLLGWEGVLEQGVGGAGETQRG